MKIFITGIAGFIGSHLADALIASGHEVSGIDNLIGGYEQNVPKDARFYKLDCLNRDGLVPLLKDIDLVYHCACTAYEGLSVFSPHFVTQNTFAITSSIVSASIAAGVKKIVYCSSMARYGAQEIPFTEGMPTMPQDPYGIAKVASENLVMNMCRVHGLDWVIVVPHNVIGPRQKYDDPYRNVASIMINRCLQGKSPIIYGDGEQMRCFSYIDDVVNTLIKVGIEDFHHEIINIGPDEGFVSINELANLIMEITEFQGQPMYYPGRPQEVKYATCSADKARELLGYEPKTDLKRSLEKIKEHILDNGVKEFKYHLPLEIIKDNTPETWTERKM